VDNVPEKLRDAVGRQGLGERVSTVVRDVRDRLPWSDASVDAVFAHMLLCMALSTQDIRAVVAEVRRVLRPGGVFVYTVRHTGDAHFGSGDAHGDDVFEHGGFAVHCFPRHLVDALAAGRGLLLRGGRAACRLWRVTQRVPGNCGR
jgi:SAM-dependent methyltransferase